MDASDRMRRVPEGSRRRTGGPRRRRPGRPVNGSDGRRRHHGGGDAHAYPWRPRHRAWP